MSSQSNRLTRKKDIQKVLNKGKVFKEEPLTLKVMPNSLKNTRFAFIISRKVSKKAVVRNKLKRRLREFVRQNFKKILPGFDVVILVRPELKKRTFQEIGEIFEKLLIRSNLWTT